MQDTKLTRRAFVSGAAVLAVAGVAALAGCADTAQEKVEEVKEDVETAVDDAKGAAKDAVDGAVQEVAKLTLLTEGKLTVATSPDYPPFENLENDEYVGLDMDLIRAVAEKMGLEVEFKTLQFDGIIPAIAAGGQADCGISAFTVDPERAKEVDFSSAYYIDDLAIVAMADNADITADNVDEALAAEGAVIAAQSGTTGEAYAKENYPAATVTGYGNATDCFAAMQAGQADAVVTNNAVAKKTVSDSYTDAQIVKEIATGEEYAIVVSKDNPALLAAINAAIAELTEEGFVESNTNKWLS